MRTLLLMTLLLLASPLAAGPDYTKDPVVFVHGYFLGDFGTWAWMKSRLTEEGWPQEYLYSFKFESVVGCNPKHAYELKAVVDKALAETGREKIDIVCHSMGCLDARYFIKYLCGYQVVKDYVSIAGAHKGTTVACADLLSCGAAQMCVGPAEDSWMKNDFLKELNWCDITPGPKIKYTSIWTPIDEIIIPQTNSIIEGAWNIKLTALVEHGLILSNEETATWVIQGLDGGGKNDNLPTSTPPCLTICPDPSPPADEGSGPDLVAQADGNDEPELPASPDETIEQLPDLETTDTPAGPTEESSAGTGGGKEGQIPSVEPPPPDGLAGAAESASGESSAPPLHPLAPRTSSGCGGAAGSPGLGAVGLLALALVGLVGSKRRRRAGR